MMDIASMNVSGPEDPNGNMLDTVDETTVWSDGSAGPAPTSENQQPEDLASQSGSFKPLDFFLIHSNPFQFSHLPSFRPYTPEDQLQDLLSGHQPIAAADGLASSVCEHPWEED
jgi:hypothetical protein